MRYRPAHRLLSICVAMLLGIAQAPSLRAAELIGLQTLTLLAELTTPNCGLGFMPSSATVDLGSMNPSEVMNAPSSVDESALDDIRQHSAFGELQAPYQSGLEPPIRLQVLCEYDTPASIPDASRFHLRFGDAAQSLAGDIPGAAVSGYLFSLTSGGTVTRNRLGFAVFVKDRHAASTGPAPHGKNGLVKPGERIAFVPGRSFQQQTANGPYIAEFAIFPGFFWARTARATEGGSFSTAIVVTLEFN